jgi:selenocysteine lyase/cysteine desulfurase
MAISRRRALAGLGGMAAFAVTPSLGGKVLPQLNSLRPLASRLPTKSDFTIPRGVTYINGAYTHPLPIQAIQAAHQYFQERSAPGAVSIPLSASNVKAEFAALINAKETEISYIPNTSTGENLVVNGLNLSYKEDNVVTDALHFEGAIMHLQALQKKYGLDLRIVMPHDWRIRLEDLERVIDKKTKLVEVSLVAMDTGFQHDLKSVCDLAHAHGAYVYADIVQAAGNTPIDVQACDVDFCACSSYKWLMGDFGLGFLYVKESLLNHLIERTQYGYYQAKSLDSHFLPGDPAGPEPYSWELDTSASGHFEVGTNAIAVTRVLGESLPYIRRLGVENILAHRQPLLKKLRKEMPRLGFEPITPPETTSALISFTVKDPKAVRERLQKAYINVRVSDRFIRISPSIYNDMSDIDRLLETLA